MKSDQISIQNGVIRDILSTGGSIEADDDGVWSVYFGHQVDLRTFSFNRLNCFPNLEWLVVPVSSTLCDDDIVALTGLHMLEHVVLTAARISDVAVIHLCQIAPLLSHLDISDTGISDDCISAVCSCSRLDFLDVSYTNISIAGLSRLIQLPNLSELKCSGLVPTEQDLSSLIAGFPSERGFVVFDNHTLLVKSSEEGR